MSDEPMTEGPGRIVRFPDGAADVGFALFGVQTHDDTTTDSFVTELRGLFAGPAGPGKVERCHRYDPRVGHETILLAYWTSAAGAAEFLASEPVSSWWNALPTDAGSTGYWREAMSPRAGRFHYFGVGPHQVGITTILPSQPTDKFGYWGGYRDRMEDSPKDDFASPLDELPAAREYSTRGRRIVVTAPDNLCFVREGADTSHVEDPTEQKLWDELLRPASQKWISYLATSPRTSGCASIIDTTEQDLESGTDLRKASQFAYFLTLGHLEHAARTQPSHLALYNAFMGAATELAEAGVAMGLFIWAEAHILGARELSAEYVNCHPTTGLLPFFAQVDAAAVA
ncbi:phenylacetaldoxime dehydratase family protein [Pseudonocardia sp. NPDC046786]|uniref:phenylacetaldoxime dehydratase family protein n=1 Tax=Pseudonocardia sp. NPDC046786 TaxID=3155471 RepID=UPI0033F06AA7